MRNLTGNRCRVVIGIDFSPPSMAAARWASRAVFPGAEFILAHALVVPEIGGLLGGKYPLPESLLANAHAGALRRLRDASSALGLPNARLEVREGRPSDAIAAIVRDLRADIVVIGKHGEGGAHRGYAGHTADQLVRSSPASILVTNGPLQDAPETIIVPLTWSSITSHIIDRARLIADATEARVVALHVIGSAVLSHVLSMAGVRHNEPVTADQIDEMFKEDADRWKNQLVSAGIPAARITSDVVFGEVSSSVLGAAKEHGAGLIVMGSHAGPLRRILLGSAASAVLRDSDIPVLVVVEPDKVVASGVVADLEISRDRESGPVYTI